MAGVADRPWRCRWRCAQVRDAWRFADVRCDLDAGLFGGIFRLLINSGYRSAPQYNFRSALAANKTYPRWPGRSVCGRSCPVPALTLIGVDDDVERQVTGSIRYCRKLLYDTFRTGGRRPSCVIASVAKQSPKVTDESLQCSGNTQRLPRRWRSSQ